MAIMPGTITSSGKTILGMAAISGVRRAADIERAAIARCTTRKSVHQYPNASTNQSPISMPNHSTPIGLAAALPVCAQVPDQVPGANPRLAATPSIFASSACQPPTSFSPISTSGRKPSTIRKNCSTSL